MEIARGRPASSGTLADPNGIAQPARTYVPVIVTSTTSTTPAPPLIRHEGGGPLYLSPYPTLRKVPAVIIRHHSEPHESHAYIPPVVPSTTPAPFYVTVPESTYLPSSTPTSVFRHPIVVSTPSDNDLYNHPTSTPSPIDHRTPIAVLNSRPTPISATTAAPYYPTPTLSGSTIEQINNELEPPHVFPHDRQPPPQTFTPAADYSPISSTTARPPIGAPLFDRSAYRNRPTPFAQYPPKINGDIISNGLGDGYSPQYPIYDGISANKDGFAYYLPKLYHEENNLNSRNRDGSFGYVDPFGIRRVIYYNAGNGFNIRQNNRYVGHNGTPYDPRPLALQRV